jgi:uncharacterized protein YfaS (alpha-2-macroglobulin family)
VSLRYYDVGDVAELTGTFTDPETGDAVDPADVTCTARKPDGSTTTLNTSGSNGVYTAELELDQHGTWWYAFDGTGSYQASGERRLEVRKPQVPRA